MSNVIVLLSFLLVIPIAAQSDLNHSTLGNEVLSHDTDFSVCVLTFEGCDDANLKNEFIRSFYNCLTESKNEQEAFAKSLVEFKEKHPNSELVPKLSCD